MRPSTAIVLGAFGVASACAAHAFTATVRPIVQLTAGGVDSTTTLPMSESAVDPGMTFYVEIWAQTSDPNGLSSVSLDLTYDPVVASAISIAPTALFSDLTSGAIDNTSGRIDDVSGSHLGPCSDAVGVAPGWARVAVIEMSSMADGVLLLESTPTGTPALGTAVCGVGDLDPSEVGFSQETVFVGDVSIPAVSPWGALIFGIALMIAATLVLRSGTGPFRTAASSRAPSGRWRGPAT